MILWFKWNLKNAEIIPVNKWADHLGKWGNSSERGHHPPTSQTATSVTIGIHWNNPFSQWRELDVEATKAEGVFRNEADQVEAGVIHTKKYSKKGNDW